MNFARSPSPQAPIAIGARLDAKTTMIWPILPPALIHTGVSNTMPHLELDKTDIKILAALQQNGRLTNVELADAVALSPSPCLRRLKHLEESGIIKRYVALLDPTRLGLGLQAFVNVALEKRGSVHMQSFLQAVQRWPEVIACYALTGDMDYMLHVYCEDLDHFSRFVMGELLTHPGVEDLRSSFVLTDVKRTTALPLHQLGAPR